MGRAKQKKQNFYFTKCHELAIIEYINTNSLETRTKLYIEYIQPVFDEMVDKIVHTFRFTKLPNIEILKDDCKIWLVTVLDKYDSSKNSKAFTFFSVITKNWFIHKTKEVGKTIRKEVPFEEVENYLVENNVTYLKDRAYKEFWEFLLKEIGIWEYDLSRINDLKVLEAIKILFENSDNIEIFNKKAIYLYLRELTGLTTKQIVTSLNKFRIKYQIFKTKWNRGEF